MDFHPTRMPISAWLLKTVMRSSLFVILFALLAVPLFSTSSASLTESPLWTGLTGTVRGVDSTRGAASMDLTDLGVRQLLNASGAAAHSLVFLPQAPVETIAIYQADCITPATSFNLGQSVCATITGAPLGSRPTQILRRLNIANPGGYGLAKADVTTNQQNLLFTLPTAATSTFGDITVDNRGTWKAISVSTSSGGVRTSASFQVTDPAKHVADLSLKSYVPGGAKVPAGDDVTFAVYLINYGPDAAEDVEVTADVPSNTTFVSEVNTNPGFSCTNPSGGAGTSTCTIASLPRGAKVLFSFTYHVNGGASPGSQIQHTTNISTVTAQRSTGSDTANAVAFVTESDPTEACMLTCPNNITVAANTTQGGQPGAVVNYAAAEGNGDCGTISASPASGSFFPVGNNLVNVSSSSGGSCSFTVNVTAAAPVTISCPTPVTKDAGNDCSTTVTLQDLGTPTTTGTGVTVEGERGDSQTLDAPYPLGQTTIIWTATDSNNNSATCSQIVTVTGTDNVPPTISAPPNVTETTGAQGATCGRIVGESELGTATADDNCSTVRVVRTGVPAGNFFPIGTTTITYTATDGAGLTATATQTVTIADNTPPIIAAPDDASYACRSGVPAANPSQATGGNVFDDNGNLLPAGPPSDNCGVPTVTVTETDNGGAGSAANPLIITRTFTATDGATPSNSSSAVQTITVADGIAPTINAPSDVTAYTGPGATSCGIDVSLGTPTTDDNCAGVTVTRSPSGNSFGVGTTDVTWTATDAAGNTATAIQHVTVNDNTVPTIAAPPDKTIYTGTGATSCSVTVADLNATLGTATAADNCPGVTWARGGGNVFQLGNTIITYTATDVHGNTASATQTVTVTDNTAPIVTPPANITAQLPLNSAATSMVVNYPNPATATDNCGGAITFSYSPASGSTFPVGTTTVTVTATDEHNNSATATFTVEVLYNFTGFFSPVGNLPILNNVNAGRAIPVKFSLSGNKGLSIFADGYPASGVITCNSSDPAAEVTETVTAGNSSLSYNSGSDQYHYVWSTQNSWAGTCRQLVIKLNDGSEHRANFRFR